MTKGVLPGGVGPSEGAGESMGPAMRRPLPRVRPRSECSYLASWGGCQPFAPADRPLAPAYYAPCRPGRLQRHLLSGEFDQLRDFPIFESNFVQVWTSDPSMFGAPITYRSLKLQVLRITSEPCGLFVSSEPFVSVSLTVHTCASCPLILKSLAHNFLFSF